MTSTYPQRLALVALLIAAGPRIDLRGQATGVIEGVVLDAEDRTGLPGVNVFLANTRIGSSTDASGAFRIDNVPGGRFELVASMIGYESEVVPVLVHEGAGLTVEFDLLPAVYEIDALEVSDRRNRRWGRQFETFLEEFLGTSADADGTRILNPEVLDFDSRFQILSATARSPLLIENSALGYTIFLLLDEFSWDPHRKRVRYSAKAFFREMKPSGPGEASIWVENRLRAYEGSPTHLLRAVVRGRSADEGFRLTMRGSGGGMRLRDGDLLGASLRANQYQLRLTSTEVLELTYTPKKRPAVEGARRDRREPEVSWIRLQHPAVMVDADGELSPRDGLIVYGDLQKRRFSDQLPIDFGLHPADAVPGLQEEFIAAAPVVALSNVNGRPFILRELGAWRPPKGASVLRAALKAIDQSDWAQAIPRLESLVEHEPDDLEAWYLLALCLRESHFETSDSAARKQAAEAFDSLVARDSTYRDVLYQYALLLHHGGQHQEAIELAEEQIRRRPDLTHASAGLFELYRPYVRAADPEEAVQWLARVQTPHSTLFRSAVLKSRGDLEAAWAVLVGLRRINRLWPEQPLLLAMARLAFLRGMRTEGQRLVRDAIAMVEDRVTAEIVFEDFHYAASPEEWARFQELERAEDLRAFLADFSFSETSLSGSTAAERRTQYYMRLVVAERDYARATVDPPHVDTVSPNAPTTGSGQMLACRINAMGLVYLLHGAPLDEQQSAVTASWRYADPPMDFQFSRRAPENEWELTRLSGR